MHVSGLNVYPIKSCRGTAVEASTLTKTGLLHDRRWMLVNDQGKFVTQREQSRLALVAPHLDTPQSPLSAIQVHAPGMSVLQVSDESYGKSIAVKIWSDTVQAFDEGDEAARWFSEFLNVSVRLVRFDDTVPRFSNTDWTGEINAANRFSDGFPILLISQASLDDLNERLPAPLPMNRFRPNLVVTGLAPYGEDELRDFGNESMQLRVVKPCTRCKITTTDQATGIAQGPQPLATLMQYRRNAQLRGVTFGQNVIIVGGIGTTLRVGQALIAM